MLNKRYVYISIFTTIILAFLLLQGFRGNTVAPSSFRFPLGFSPILLSGTFGELRNNHFHSGVDVKTGGEQGKKIFAIGDGYVYRLKVSPYGFGQAVYLRHPDGKFSVYAHLSKFNEEISEYIYQKQFASKKYDQEIYLDRNGIPVKKGDLIAYSGNSGSSLGPHLHFEIRDPEENILNPLDYYPQLFPDKVHPIIQNIGIEPLDIDSRVHGKFKKHTITPNGSSGTYYIPGIIDVEGPIGLEYHAYDLMSNVPNHMGINYSRLYLDQEKIYDFALDKFSFDEKKHINVHFDYYHYKKSGRKFQRLYREDGNQFNSFKFLKNKGVIELLDDEVHTFTIELEDHNGNVSSLTGKLRRADPNKDKPLSLAFGRTSALSYDVIREVLKITVANPNQDHLKGLKAHLSNGQVTDLQYAYSAGNRMVFLMKPDPENYPNFVSDPTSNSRLDFYFNQVVYPEQNNIVEDENLQLFFPKGAVFDTTHLEIKKQAGNREKYSKVFEIGSPKVPLLNSFVLTMTPDRKVPEEHLVIAERRANGSWRFVGRDVNEAGEITASSSHFGTFALMADSIPPRVRPIGFDSGQLIKGSSLPLKITDNFAGINSDRIFVTLDDDWLLPVYDAKNARITCKWKERPGPGAHTLEVMVMDNAGNQARKRYLVYF